MVAARRSTAPVIKFTKSPYKSLKLDQFRVFNKLFRVDDKGLALQPNSIKRQSVSGRVSKNTWNNKKKIEQNDPAKCLPVKWSAL